MKSVVPKPEPETPVCEDSQVRCKRETGRRGKVRFTRNQGGVLTCSVPFRMGTFVVDWNPTVRTFQLVVSPSLTTKCQEPS